MVIHLSADTPRELRAQVKATVDSSACDGRKHYDVHAGGWNRYSNGSSIIVSVSSILVHPNPQSPWYHKAQHRVPFAPNCAGRHSQRDEHTLTSACALSTHRSFTTLVTALSGLRGTVLIVVDLAARLTALLRPGEVRDGDEEEGVAAVGDTGEGVVPGL